MKFLLLGALLALILTIPSLFAVVVTVATALVSQPLLVAFVLGAVARPYLPVVGRWTR
ncbi:hypothetical protein ACFUG9_33950 [Streptomyces griseoincarnatus]